MGKGTKERKKKRRSWISLIFTFLICGIGLAVVVYMALETDRKASDENFEYSYNPILRGWIVTEYKGDGKKVEIPEEVDGEKVVVIGEAAFKDSNIKSVVMPDTILTIDREAFYGCQKLKNVKMSAGVKTIEWNSFTLCESLKEIELPEGLLVIEDGAFYDTGICSFHIPKSLKSIMPGAIATQAPNFSEITVDEENTFFVAVDNVLFTKNMKTLVCCPSKKSGKYTIPDGVEKIQGQAFDGCKKLTKITIPDTVKEIGDFAFGNTHSLKKIRIPESVTKVGCRLFNDSEGLKKAHISSECEIAEVSWGEGEPLTGSVNGKYVKYEPTDGNEEE